MPRPGVSAVLATTAVALSVVLPLSAAGCLSGSEGAPTPPLPDAGRVDGGGTPAPTTSPPSATAQLEVSTAPIDFGDADCGGAAPGARTLTLKNVGGGTLTWSADLGGAAGFAIDGPASGTLGAGQAVDLAMHAVAMPASAVAGEVHDATLSVTSSDPTHATSTIPLTVRAHGATLSVVPQTVDFGTVPVVQAAAELPFEVKNTGNAPVTVGFGPPSDAHFELAWTGAPTAATVAPGGTVPGLVARFRPKTPGASQGSAALTITGPVCGASASSVALAAVGSSGSAGIQPGALDFQKVDCGTAAPAQTVKVSNAGNGPLTFTAKLGTGTAYTVAPATATVAAGSFATLTVTPKPIPATSLTTADLYADSLTITTDVPGESPHVVALHETAKGARLAFTPATLDFLDVPVGQAPSNAFSLTNDGNAAATVTLATAAPFALGPVTSGTAASGAPLASSATFAPPAVGASTGAVSVTTKSVLCAPLPSLPLRGNGTKGQIALTTTRLDFGPVDCGTTAPPQTFTIQNVGSAPFDWTAALATGTAYTMTPASGTIAAGKNAVVTVAPRGVPTSSAVTPDLYADNVTVKTTIPGDTTAHVVGLHETARGAILSLAPTTIPFGGVPLGTTAQTAFRVVNDGNVPANVTLAATGASFGVSATSANAIAGGGGSATLNATFQPTDTSARTGSISVSAIGTVLCRPTPAALALSGNGLNGAVAIAPSTVSFGNAGLVACGTRDAVHTVTVSNGGNAPFTFTASLGKSALPFTISTTGGTVPAGGSIAIDVTPPLLTPPLSTAAGAYDGSLVITTSGIAGDTPNPHVIPLRLTAQGAVLSATLQSPYPTTAGNALSFGSQSGAYTPQSPVVTLQNTGNAPATVRMVTAAGSAFGFNPASATVGAASTTGVTGTFTPTAPQAYSDTLTFDTTGTTVCASTLPSVALAGQGSFGQLVVTAAPPDFGRVCASIAPSQNNKLQRTFTLQNQGNAALTWSAPKDLSQRGLFQIVGTPTRTLAAGASTTVSVQPLDVTRPAGAYKDAFNLASTSGPGVTVPLSATATGIVWELTSTSFPVPVGTRQAAVQITNYGNLDAEVSAQTVTNPKLWQVQNSYLSSLPPGTTQTINLIFLRDAGNPPYTDTLRTQTNIQIDPPICAPLPTYPLTAN